ncbi:MAG: hypothetical protein K6T88_22885 [Bacillus sp. (in: Bacteria)]|nr:hypothetical protein [Bacillus sp. (in: firmicutes)]
MSNSIRKFKEDVESIIVPEKELKNVINSALNNEFGARQGKLEAKKKKRYPKWIMVWLLRY